MISTLTTDYLSDLAGELGAAATKYDAWGIRLPRGSRLFAVQRELQRTVAAGTLPSTAHDLKRLAYAFRDAEDFARVADVIKDPPTSALRADIERSLQGSLAGIGHGSRAAVQYQTQLWAGAVLAYSQIPVRAPSGAASSTPDLEITIGTLHYAIEVKRPLTGARPDRLISKAARQIASGRYHGGCVIVDVTDCMPDEGISIGSTGVLDESAGMAELMVQAQALEDEIFDTVKLKIERGRGNILTLVTTARHFAADTTRPGEVVAARRMRAATFWHQPRGTLRYHRGEELAELFDRGIVGLGHSMIGKTTVVTSGT